MPRIRATYRLQLHAGFPLSRVRALVPYLSRLGVSHLHCSPMLRARRGSTHGYDVVDPNELDPELGTAAELEALYASCASGGWASSSTSCPTTWPPRTRTPPGRTCWPTAPPPYSRAGSI
ncbi:MAG: hypothetical protein H0V43_02260 [Gemmatimonadales bacterium]|nr:hypothetical protein [Gemmatimonadales bacterium]